MRYTAHVSNWAWAMFGGAVTLAAAAAVILWQAFKHLDLKIDRLDDKIDRLDDKIEKKFDEHRNYFDKKFDDQRNYTDEKFDQLMGGIAEVSRLVAGHDAQLKAQEKQIDRLSTAAFAPSRFGAASQHQERAHQEEAHASEPAAPAESAAPAEAAAAPSEGITSSAGGPEPTPPAAIAPA